MKVVLTAFGGKLKSDIQDWPEGTCEQIKMVLDKEPGISSATTFLADANEYFWSKPAVCVFSYHKSYYRNDCQIYEYRLTGLS